jgi:hypothetical protein
MPYYWLGGRWTSDQEDPESDVHWLNEGYIAGVPIHVGELTDHGALDKHKAHIESKFDKLLG